MKENIDIPYENTSLIYERETSSNVLDKIADMMVAQEKENKENGDYTSSIYAWMLLTHANITPTIFGKALEGLDGVLSEEFESSLFDRIFQTNKTRFIMEVFQLAENGNRTAKRGMAYFFCGKFPHEAKLFRDYLEEEKLILDDLKKFSQSLLPSMMGWDI
jgi:hypothetical protein